MTTEAAANPPPFVRGVLAIPLIAVSVGVAILLGLGVWQLQRLRWKEDLLSRIAALQSAPAEPLVVVLNRLPPLGQEGAHLAGSGQVNYVRAQTTCPTLQQTPSLHLYAIIDGVMGYRTITACPMAAGPYRSLLVDRGFTPADQMGRLTPGPVVSAPVVGVLRQAERSNWLSPPNDAVKNDWHTRDLAAMALALGAPAPAPVFLMLESPKPTGYGPTGFGPTPAAIPTDLPNNHLGYALTWFGLAGGLVATYVSSLLRTHRGR